MAMTINVNMSGVNQTEYNTEDKQKEAGKKSNNIYAGNITALGKDMDSRIAQKKSFAQEQAMKLIRDAWDGDEEFGRQVEELSQTRTDDQEDIHKLRAQLSDIEDVKADLQKEYGVDPNSQEQKDLEILEKFQNYKGGSYDESFSDDDISRLKELQNEPRTEYQQKVLEQNAGVGEIKKNIAAKKAEIQGIGPAIFDTELEQLKYQGLRDANDAADALLDAAAADVMGILMQDGVDKIDDKNKEAEETAEKTQEKKDEQQERIDKAQDKNKENNDDEEEIIKASVEADKLQQSVNMNQQSDVSVEDVQQNIQKIIKDNKLLDEDLKGIKIDFNF